MGVERYSGPLCISDSQECGGGSWVWTITTTAGEILDAVVVGKDEGEGARRVLDHWKAEGAVGMRLAVWDVCLGSPRTGLDYVLVNYLDEVGDCPNGSNSWCPVCRKVAAAILGLMERRDALEEGRIFRA